jgi:hypothetical protein
VRFFFNLTKLKSFPFLFEFIDFFFFVFFSLHIFISFEKGSFRLNISLTWVFSSILIDDRSIDSAKYFKCETKMRHKSTIQNENEADKRCLGDKRLVGFKCLFVQLLVAILASKSSNCNFTALLLFLSFFLFLILVLPRTLTRQTELWLTKLLLLMMHAMRMKLILALLTQLMARLLQSKKYSSFLFNDPSIDRPIEL